MRFLNLIIAILIFGISYAQKSVPVLYDTTDKIFKFIDLSKVDTVSAWNYELDLEWRGYISDSIEPSIGRLSFFRITPITNYWNQTRRPYVRYDIYFNEDSLAAYKFSKYIKSISSCFPLQGGERLRIGKFILVNSDVCSGDLDKTGNEICRPLVNYVLTTIDMGKSHSIQELVEQLPLNESVLKFD